MQTVTRDQAALPGHTFVPAPAGAYLNPGNRWTPFGASAEPWLTRAFELLAQGRRIEEPEALRALPIPPHCAPGLHTLWPASAPMVGASWRLPGREPELASVYPYFDAGRPQRLVLERVYVWRSGVEAQLAVCCGRLRLHFFDTLFAATRRRYRAGEAHAFRLAGIAQAAGRAMAGMGRSGATGLRTALDRLLGRTAGEAEPEWVIFDGAEGGGADEYTFRAPVAEATPVQEVLGQPAWLLRLLLPAEAEGAALDVLVTRAAWQGARPPEAGDVIEGRLWLQGRLAGRAGEALMPGL